MSEAITLAEQVELTQYEDTIQEGLKSFVEVGSALAAIRDKRLYRADYDTFEAYCADKWQIGRAHAYRLMDASDVVRNVSNWRQDGQVPANEAQTRPLAVLPPAEQARAWDYALETAQHAKVTAAHVQQAIDQINGQGKPAYGPEHGIAPEPTFGPNYKRDSRVQIVADSEVANSKDDCQTPFYALDPLYDYVPKSWHVWEPAVGKGYLAGALRDAGYQVKATGLSTNQNYFQYEPDNWDVMITNIPFTLKVPWLERAYQLGKPFALLMPSEAIAQAGTIRLFEKYGIEILQPRKRIDYEMPFNGWVGTAQFPSAWYTFGLEIGSPLTFVDLPRKCKMVTPMEVRDGKIVRVKS